MKEKDIKRAANILIKRETEKDTEKTVDILMGNGFLRSGKLDYGLELYKKIGIEIPQDELVACGDANIKKGNFYTLLDIYEVIGAKVPENKFIEIGAICFVHGRFDEAIEAYRMAGDKAKLIELGDAFIKREEGIFKEVEIEQEGYERLARKAYRAAVRLP